MARNKIDPAVSRKAYAAATSRLKELNADQFAMLLDEAYSDQGVESPRNRRDRLAEEAAQARLAAAAKRQARQDAKIAEAKALLEAAGLSVIPGTENAA
jgi:hypothetical protein